ncbi:hypothetical protein PCH_Pc22g00650 [Penicillium rubens Wisconsin 54-1255]|uniref:Uncharacterized protein n=1 Tax=Penicillium rubens (strain ATCC 28089 / DSM 1075 / NRRL 1951 / Wisconsin 54-1255) TaxID=500485 RepID=B6HPH8_PENRW|nr:hypothetical protein PCH_Pc22g00650 [Penicillium rubens Wisconsin 54-1255]
MGKPPVASLVSSDFRPNDNMQEQFTSGRNLNARPKWCHIYHIWARNTPLPRSFAPHIGKDQGVKSGSQLLRAAGNIVVKLGGIMPYFIPTIVPPGVDPSVPRATSQGDGDGDMINITIDRSGPLRRNAGFPTCIWNVEK